MIRVMIIEEFLAHYQWLLLVIILWSLPWKGYALWKASRRNQPLWFVILFLVNTAGLLEILYIFALSKSKQSETL